MKKATNKQQTMVVVSTNERPPPQADYAAFDRFIAHGQAMARTWKELGNVRDQLEDAEQSEEWRFQYDALKAIALPDREKFKARYQSWEAERTTIFDSESLYDQIDGRWFIKRRVVVENSRC